MTDTSSAPAQTGDQAEAQPTIVIVSASQVAASFLSRFPGLAAYKESLDLIAGLYATHVKNPLGTPSYKEAVSDLDTSFSTDLDGVRAAIAELTHCDVELASAFADTFKGKTGRSFNIKTLNFTGAVQDETAEQRDQERLARELADRARDIVARLHIADSFNVSATPAKPKRGSLLVGFVNSTAAKITRTPIKQEVGPATPDWNTDPILDKDDNDGEINDEYVRLDKFLDRVIALINKFAAQPNMRELVLQMLANGRPPVTEKDIEESVFEAFKLSHDTLEQTTTILSGVGRDAQYFADWVDGLKDLRAMYGSVAALFFPAK